MALWWLYGGYVFPVVVRPENLTFQVKFDLEGQGQLPSKTTKVLTKLFCTSGPNLVILAWMGNELWCGQAQNGVNSDFQVKFDLEGQGQLPPKTIETLTKVFCIFGPNLVKFGLNGSRVIAWTSKWLTHRLTHRLTHPRTQTTTIPEGQNWPWVKTCSNPITRIQIMASYQLWKKSHYQNAALGNSIIFCVTN